MPASSSQSSTSRRPTSRSLNTAIPSGRGWAARFPVSTTTRDLTVPFRTNVDRFLAALRQAGATIIISSTFRTPERGYLMHWCWRIVNQNVNPTDVPSMAGVNINWVHEGRTPQEARQRGVAAANEMVIAFNIQRLGVAPALRSRHMLGFGIDMNIQWSGTLSIADADGNVVVIESIPRTGLNQQLHRVGATYGVIKTTAAGAMIRIGRTTEREHDKANCDDLLPAAGAGSCDSCHAITEGCGQIYRAQGRVRSLPGRDSRGDRS
jgi:hypothetical protein